MKFPTFEEMVKEVAEKAMDEYKYNGKTIREWVELIRDTASDQTVKAVEVVRCKDCVYFRKDIKPISEGAAGICNLRMIHGQYGQYCCCQGDEFCSYGKKQEMNR